MGLTLNKATYLWWMHSPGDPAFPLDPEVVSMIPDELPGPMPETGQQLVQLSRRVKGRPLPE